MRCWNVSMRCERFAASEDAIGLAVEIRALVPAAESVSEAVREILDRVRTEGDPAVLDYTRRFDTAGSEPLPLLVTDAELDRAVAELDPAVRHGLERAIANVQAVAGARGRGLEAVVDLGTHVVSTRRVPVARAAVYVPGGRAPYPSTVVMGVVPARLAGVEEIAVCAPPGGDGEVDGAILAACRLAGAQTLYRMGGAQAIAALAYGTQSVPAVDVIVGPGNLYVQEAKRQVFGAVGIDGFAGPSDLLVLAAADSDAETLALDLLAQAEHGPGTLVVAVSESTELLDALGVQLERAADTGAVACLVELKNTELALALSEAFAPEHLQLVGEWPESLAGTVTRAGCVFVGAAAGTAFGDYIAGSNHILPTAGAARFASGLSPEHFLRGAVEVRISEPAELAREAAPVARAEGFELHARSMESRIRDNPPR
jgi:histidinol dehydrogenase